MNVLLIGSGGREHAIALAISKSKQIKKLLAAPGNPGMANIAELVKLDIKNHSDVIDFCKSNKIDLVVVGPEQPLAEGIADSLNEADIPCFGPTKYAAQLESSKDFAKEFMAEAGIPTAAFKSFNKDEIEQAYDYLDNHTLPIVLKADGLAAGKGVIICNTHEDAKSSIKQMFEGMFGSSGERVVVEEFMQGEEASILAISDGNDFVILASSQDHKRAYDGDKGPNTGGMGAYSPAKIVTEDIELKIINRIIKPAIDKMKADGHPFVGCLYAGLMIHENEAKVVEFNVRLGDPEAQSVLSVFDGDFLELIYSSAKGMLNKDAISKKAKSHAVCLILASDGYPGSYEKGYEITGIEKAEEQGAIVYHAGTKQQDGKLMTSGGRVLGVTALGNDLKHAIEKAYQYADLIEFENKYYRKDIGQKGL